MPGHGRKVAAAPGQGHWALGARPELEVLGNLGPTNRGTSRFWPGPAATLLPLPVTFPNNSEEIKQIP